MRALLAELIADSAASDPDYIVLSGDHGYALFDPLRRRKPEQFVNAGVAEQGMVGLAAGLAREGFRPLVYGLSAFVPMRVLEQIKIDVCFSRLPVVFLGDGAGLVYSTLGASHQCAEDLACLRPLPHLRIYSPCDAEELRACYQEAFASREPSYIRVGKSDRPAVNEERLASTRPHFVRRSANQENCLVATGSMVAPCAAIAEALGLSCLSVPKIKPLDDGILATLAPFGRAIVVEEHSVYGGLASAILERTAEDGAPSKLPVFRSIGLADRFSELCGSYQYALSEHDLDDVRLLARVKSLVAEPLGR
ncbi:MAG TPA: transketolase C-terminal domain-containing protein [Elusimicrobiota bacterium]|jgi:transketolase|nr:transketolase C-terminal domain-containing protein [Elusimicrobiota bacterium]